METKEDAKMVKMLQGVKEITLEYLVNHEFEKSGLEEIQTVNPGKLGQTVKLLIPFEVKKGWILRRKK